MQPRNLPEPPLTYIDLRLRMLDQLSGTLPVNSLFASPKFLRAASLPHSAGRGPESLLL